MTGNTYQPIIPGAAYLWNETLCMSDAEGEFSKELSDIKNSADTLSKFL